MSVPEILTFISYISSAFILFPFIAGILRYRTFNTYLKVLFIYIVFAFCTEITNFYFVIIDVKSSIVWYACSIVEFSAFCYMYCVLLKIKRHILITIIVTGLFTLLSIIDAFYIEGVRGFNMIPRNTEGIILIIASIAYFYTLMIRTEHRNILSIPAFWINIGVLTYFSGTFFLILFSNYVIEKSNETYIVLAIIHSILNITLNSTIAVGFIKQKNAH